MVTIDLTDNDFDKCVEITRLQQEENVRQKHRTKYGQLLGLTFEQTLQGCLGEQALAHYFKFDYQYLPYDKNRYDILGYEVRTTYYPTGCLLTHPEPDDKPGMYIAVTFDKNELVATLQGWSSLKRCNIRQDNWRSGPNWRYPCFAIQQDQLIPMEILPATKELIAHQQSTVAA